jgi:SAM-dependent methyltransferase
MHKDIKPTTAEAAGKIPAPLYPVDRTLSIDELMERVRAEVAHRRVVQSEETDEEGDRADNKRHQLPRWSGSARRLAAKPSYELGDLLQFTDEEFISVAFRVILRRPADVEGATHYLEALRGGRSKIQILGDLRFSPEGWRNNVHINGLMIPYKLYGLQDRPVIGRFARFLLGLARLPRLPHRLQAAENSSGRNLQELGGVVNRISEELDTRLAGFEDEIATRATVAALRVVEQCTDTLAGQLDQLRGQVSELSAGMSKVAARLSLVEEGLIRTEARGVESARAIEALAAESAGHRRSVLDLQRRLMGMAAAAPAAGASIEPPRGEMVPQKPASGAVNDILNADYVSFEDSFRGEREDIKKRCAHYLKSLQQAEIHPDAGLILDLGCGRGEWLELLRESGYLARGVDLNAAMLEDSREHGLDVVEADALAYLASLPEDSVAAITSMHLVEHLPHDVLIQLLDESLRVLKPGGLLALETPNPENITVGSCWFYLDPTHRNPLPPALLQWIVSNRGFSDSRVERLSEFRGVPAIERLADDVPGSAQINEMAGWFTAAPDYAILARRE